MSYDHCRAINSLELDNKLNAKSLLISIWYKNVNKLIFWV